MRTISKHDQNFWDRKRKEEAAQLMKSKIDKGYEATTVEVMEMNKWLPVEEMVNVQTGPETLQMPRSAYKYLRGE